MEFTAETVWACAAAAHRMNDGYLKDDKWMMHATPPYLDKTANKTLVKNWLRTSNFSELTEVDYENGRRYRDHFKGYTLLAIKGELNDFQRQAFKIATAESFTGRMMLEFAIVSCLPSVAERDQTRTDLKKEIYSSTQLVGNVGDTIISDMVVVDCKYIKAYEKFKVNGRMGESYVDFWISDDLSSKKGETVRIKGKIKSFRGDKTTQLNYVKKV